MSACILCCFFFRIFLTLAISKSFSLFLAYVTNAIFYTICKLQVLEVQLPGKKVVNAAAFWNGLRGQNVKVV